jgi:hypothetical protein
MPGGCEATHPQLLSVLHEQQLVKSCAVTASMPGWHAESATDMPCTSGLNDCQPVNKLG